MFYKNMRLSSGIFETCGILINFLLKSRLLVQKSAILFKFVQSGVLIKSGLLFMERDLFNMIDVLQTQIVFNNILIISSNFFFKSLHISQRQFLSNFFLKIHRVSKVRFTVFSSLKVELLVKTFLNWVDYYQNYSIDFY